MKSPKQTLAIVAFTTLVGCSSPTVPATMPDASASMLRLYATSATLPLVIDLTEAYSDRQLTFETRSSSFRTALNSLIEGETPYLFTSHLPSHVPAPDGLSFSLWAAPVAQDGIAIIVNPAVPFDQLSLDGLRSLYLGRNETGHDLVVFSREEGSDTRAEFERLVMGSRRTTLAARLVTSSETMVSAVAQTPGAVGYVSLAYVTQQVRTLAIDGVAPTPQSIAQHRYPLRLTLFVAGLEEPAGSYRSFIGWIQSPEGQQVVGKRYVPLVLKSE
jgi:hypothetical protein